MWSEADLASLDTISKGLRNVHIEPRQEADLWLRGSATLDSPLKEWDFEDSTSTAGSSRYTAERTDATRTPQLLYPLRIKFDVALANQPEYEFTATCLRHHYKTWKALAQDQILAPSEAIALHDGPEGLWAVTVDHSEEPLPAWWDRQVRRRIHTLDEIRDDVRSSGSDLRRGKTAFASQEHSPGRSSQHDDTPPRVTGLTTNTLSAATRRPQGNAILSNGAKRAVYDDDFEERVLAEGERQWLTAVEVLIQMANWVAVLEARDYRLLMCRPRYFSVSLPSVASSPEKSTAKEYFDIRLRSFATVEQANALAKPESYPEVAAYASGKILEEIDPSKGLARNMVEHGLRVNLRYIAPEVVAADHTVPEPSVDIFAWAVASYELIANRAIESVAVVSDHWDLLDAIHHHSTRQVTSLSAIHDTMPIELSQLIEKALALDPADRYNNASTLLQDLYSIRQICAGDMTEAARADFVVGDIVRLSTFVFPPKLLDREQEEMRLDNLYSRVKLTGTPEVACCYGRSGSGKSQLIADWATKQELKNTGQDCLVGWAKLDQHLLRPLSGFIGVFCSLLDRVFSDPLEDPVRWKKNILNAVAANANLFLSLLPAEWQRVLGPDNADRALAAETQTVDWDSYIKQFRSWATMLLRLFASRPRPLILVIDDYQWMEASERALWHELASVPSRRVEHCFIVLSYRTAEQDVAPDIAPIVGQMIESRRFDIKVVNALLLESFHLDYMSVEWQTLAESILSTSEGNPLFCNQILLAYVRDNVIHFDFEAKRWQIRREALVQYGTMSSEQYSGRTFSLFEPELQGTLQRLACLPSRGVKIDLLAKTAHLTPEYTRMCLRPAVDNGMVRVHNDEVVFSHDRHHLAAIASTPEGDKKGLYLSVAEALEGLSSPELNFVRADLLLSIYRLDKEYVAIPVLCRALLLATQRAIRGLASDLAQRYLSHAQAIWNFDRAENWQQDAEMTMLLVGAVAEVAIAKRIAGSVIKEVEVASDLAPTVLQKVQALTWLCRLYLAAERGSEACDLVVRAYALAGVTMDLGKSAPEDCAVVHEYANMPRLPVVTEFDRVSIALTILFTVMGPTIYVFVPDFGRSYFQTAGAFLLQRRAAAALKFEASAYVFAILGLLALDELNIEMARSWLALSETIDVTGTPYQAPADIGRMVVRIIRCQRLSELESDYASVRESAIATKNPDILIYICGLELATILLSGHSISRILANGKIGLTALGDDLPSVSRLMATSVTQLAHNLTTSKEDNCDASELQGEYVTEADVKRIPTAPPFYAIFYAVASLVLGLLYGVSDAELSRREELVRKFEDGGNGTILQSMAIVLLAISTLVSKAPTDLKLVNKAKAYLKHFTSNLNFVALMHVLDSLDLLRQAEEHKGTWTSAMECVEGTLLLLHDAEAYLWEGFLCGRAAITFEIIGRGTARLATGYTESARKAYERCGAIALVGPARFGSFAPLRPPSIPTSLMAIRSPASSADPDSLRSMSDLDLPLSHETTIEAGGNLQQKIGLESILRTSVLLASEPDGEGLIRRVLAVLLQMTRTTYACLAIQDHTDGALTLRGYGDHENIQVCEATLADAGGLCPASLLLHVSVTKKAINTTSGMDPAHNKLFEREPFFKTGGPPRSVIVSPILVQGRLSGAIYLAARAGVPAVSTSHVGLLATFAAIILKSHHAYATLEAAVETRTNQLEQALAHRQTFISAISHELRTPLFAVAGLCSVMESDLHMAPEHRENLSIIKQSSEDLQRIVTAVLDWSKLDAGSIQAESIDFDLRSIVESATVTVGHIAQAKSVEIVVENSVETDPKWALLGDPHRFRQCLLNILSNALKFTPLSQTSRPKIQIRWVIDERADSVDITVAVQDEGIGIPRKAMNKLFGAFVQVDVGTARNYGGTGLGLSITRGLCRAMGGDCWAESVEGKGSTFYLLVSTKRTQTLNKPPWLSLAHAHQRAALLTDLPCRFDSLSRNLRNWNIEVEAFVQADRQPTSPGTKPFNFVILDMASTAHVQNTLAQARTDYPGAKLILLAGPAEVEVYKKAAESNQWIVLSKPTTTHALYSATARVQTEHDSRGRLVAAAEIGRKASPSLKRPMSSLMDKAFGQKYPLKILYVDDSSVNVKVGQKILEKFGYRNIDTAEDGRIAVAAAERTAYDLVFMDLQMPEMDGYTARNIIHAKQGKDCPAIVALTANTDDATKQRCMEEGFFHFLSKPLNIKSLSEVIKLAYANRHPQQLEANTIASLNGHQGESTH